MTKISSPATPPTPSLSVQALVGAAIVLALSAAVLAGWLAYGDGIYMALIDGVLAWCM